MIVWRNPYENRTVELEYALDIQDEELTLAALKRVLERVDTIQAAKDSLLYAHMNFNHTDINFAEQLRCKLKQEFRNDERCCFLRSNSDFEDLTK